MNNLEIIIQRKVGDAWPVVVEHHRPDALSPVRKEGILRLDETELLRQSSPLDYGRVLGEALFRGEVGDAFVAARAQSRAEERSRIRRCGRNAGSACVPGSTASGICWRWTGGSFSATTCPA